MGLAERLREPRIRRIIEPMLIGAVPSMDIMKMVILIYARDMGLGHRAPGLAHRQRHLPRADSAGADLRNAGLSPSPDCLVRLRQDGTLA